MASVLKNSFAELRYKKVEAACWGLEASINWPRNFAKVSEIAQKSQKEELVLLLLATGCVPSPVS